MPSSDLLKKYQLEQFSVVVESVKLVTFAYFVAFFSFACHFFLGELFFSYSQFWEGNFFLGMVTWNV